MPDCSNMALAWGGIFGCPLAMLNVTTPIRTVEIPNAVKGVECNTKNARMPRNVPIAVRVIASVEYLLVKKEQTSFLMADYKLPSV